MVNKLIDKFKDYYTLIIYDEIGSIYDSIIFKTEEEAKQKKKILYSKFKTLSESKIHVAVGLKFGSTKNKFEVPPWDNDYSQAYNNKWEKAFEKALIYTYEQLHSEITNKESGLSKLTANINILNNIKNIPKNPNASYEDCRILIDQLPSDLNPFHKDYKLKVVDKEFNTILIKWIEERHYEFYIPFFTELFKRDIGVDEMVIETLAIKNPNLTFFTPKLMELVVKRHDIEHNNQDFSYFYYRIRESVKYKNYLCTLIKNGVRWYNFLYDYYRLSSDLFNTYFDCWDTYMRISSNKIVDNEKQFNIFNEILNVQSTYTKNDYRKVIGSILYHLKLDPHYKLFDEIHEEKDLNLDKTTDDIHDLLTYILDICKFIDYTVYRVNFFENNPTHKDAGKDKELLEIFRKCFPFKSNSRFVSTLRYLIKQNFNIPIILEDENAEEKLFNFRENFIHYLSNVILFLQNYYSIEVEYRDETDTKDFELSKQDIQLHGSFKSFIQTLPEIHRNMILLRTPFLLQSYLSKESIQKDLNKIDSYGLTPLAYAVLYRNKNAVKTLITTSASIHNQQMIGKKKIDYNINLTYMSNTFSILELASSIHHKEIYDLLDTKKNMIKRWKSNQLVGYHQTSEEIVKIIQETHQNSYWFLAGSTGMYGAGIYFARTPEETNIKAIGGQGIILKTNLFMGNPFPIRTFKERDEFQKIYYYLDVDIIHQRLQKIGYDSVIAYRDNRPKKMLPIFNGKHERFMETGDELILYNTEQVEFTGETMKRESSYSEEDSSSYTSEGGYKHVSLIKQKMYLNPVWMVPLQENTYTHLTKDQLNERGLLNTTPLMIASRNGNIKAVEWLLKYVHLNDTDSMKRNALFYAMQGGNKKIIKMLLSHKIDVFTPDAHGDYIVDYFNIDKNDTSYRTVLLNALYKMGAKANPLIVRFYLKTGRFSNPEEKKRYEDYVHSMYKDIEKPILTHMEIPKKYTVATAAGGKLK